jgi:hypothetical protein
MGATPFIKLLIRNAVSMAANPQVHNTIVPDLIERCRSSLAPANTMVQWLDQTFFVVIVMLL